METLEVAMKSCQFDINLSVPRMRSLRVNGMSTCFRLEEIYWTLLDRIAARAGVSVSVVVSSWARYADLRYGGVPNLSSFVRICCLMHMCEQELEALSTRQHLIAASKHVPGRTL